MRENLYRIATARCSRWRYARSLLLVDVAVGMKFPSIPKPRQEKNVYLNYEDVTVHWHEKIYRMDDVDNGARAINSIHVLHGGLMLTDTESLATLCAD